MTVQRAWQLLPDFDRCRFAGFNCLYVIMFGAGVLAQSDSVCSWSGTNSASARRSIAVSAAEEETAGVFPNMPWCCYAMALTMYGCHP